jgi:hypothetical protein
MDNRFRISFTSRKTAAAALSPGQGMEHLFHFRVGFDMKLVGCHGQSDTEKEADAPQQGHTTQGEFY